MQVVYELLNSKPCEDDFNMRRKREKREERERERERTRKTLVGNPELTRQKSLNLYWFPISFTETLCCGLGIRMKYQEILHPLLLPV